MQRKKARRKLIQPLKVTGLPFVQRAKLARKLVQGGLYGSELVKLADEAGISAYVESAESGCGCCVFETVRYSTKTKEFSFSSVNGSFTVLSFGFTRSQRDALGL